MEISLLSDTGIQFYDGEIVLDLSKRINNPLFFYQNEEQDFFNGTKKVVLHSLYRDKNTDCFYPYSLLNFDENGQLLTTNFTTIKPINEDDIIIVKDISKILNNYQEEWLPIPYFNKNQLNGQYLFGPSGWARLYLKIEEKSQNSLKIKYTLSFDTTIGKQNDEHESRILLHEIDTNEGYNKFGLCSDIHNNMRFLNNDSKNEWVDDALKIISKKNKHGNVNSLDYSAEYLFLIHYLSSNDLLPNVFLHKSNQHDYINVDLILDIGNSRTCGLIFEDSMADGSFNFTSVKKLEIRNISQPWEVYDDPFSMNLTLHKAKIGNYSIPGFSKIFSWPSILRIGKEAQILLNKYDVSQFIFDEPLNTLSSPKRYLWDKDISTKYWEFISLDNKKAGHASYDGLTGYMSPGGEVLDKPTNAYSTWSKSSMMVFVYIEILNHVYAQINSFKFRSDVDGEIKKLRKLRSIVITCPTAMTEFEQFELRESARKAVLIIDKYTKDIQSEFNEPDSMGFNFSSLVEKPIIYTEGNGDSIQIIPRPKDISTADDETNKRLDWIYDEASCSQINFIYAEVAKKYANNFKAFFEIYGQGNSKQNLKVATLDIGGGTSDLVITQYSYDSNNALPYLTPDPLFYETYNIAGDDLLKEVIHQVLIDGAEKFEKKTFGIGQIRQYAERIGCPNVSDLILHFFGEHAGFMGAQHRYYRKYFVKQVLLPIANKILEYAKGEKPENKVFSFDDVFLDNPPNDSLINYINKIFGGSFDFKAIEWEFSVERINAIIEYRFKDLFKQISFILKSFNCDFFLLTGKPSEIKHK